MISCLPHDNTFQITTYSKNDYWTPITCKPCYGHQSQSRNKQYRWNPVFLCSIYCNGAVHSLYAFLFSCLCRKGWVSSCQCSGCWFGAFISMCMLQPCYSNCGLSTTNFGIIWVEMQTLGPTAGPEGHLQLHWSLRNAALYVFNRNYFLLWYLFLSVIFHSFVLQKHEHFPTNACLSHFQLVNVKSKLLL